MRIEYGKLIEYQVLHNTIELKYQNKMAYIKIVSPDIINFFVPMLREERNSKAVTGCGDKLNNFNVTQDNEKIKITTDKLIVEVYENFVVDIYNLDGEIICADYRGKEKPFIRRTSDYDLAKEEGHDLKYDTENKIYLAKALDDEMYFYGLGERPGSLNKKGCHYVNWNTDNPAPHGETFLQLYKSIPFMLSIKEKDAFGIFFDNYFETHFDLGRDNSEYYYFSAVDGNLDYYFIYGPQVSDVVDGYTYLTGRTPLPQLWTLGFQQCRWSYAPEERVMEIAKSFREKDIPCDTIYLDIDYMDGYRVFTWDNKKFKNPQEMISKLNHMGFKVVTIIDPGVKVDKGYKIYDEGLKYDLYAKDNQGIVYRNKVWPGDSVYPDFINSKTREWWASNQKIMTNTGVSGIWNDMNEPASFNGPLPDDIMFNDDGIPVTHKEVHNIYGAMMCKATYEGLKKANNKRPFVVTRACYAGTQKYSTIWTGDNQSTWEHLRMSLPMLMNLGISGMGFCGTDVGGFGHDCTPELLSRWVQVGAFTPLFRNHAAMGTRDQEPWAFDYKTEEINRKYIKLRYKLIPYIYDMFRKCETTGAPIVRPLLFNYQNDKNTYQISDEFLCGDNILVSPVIEQGASKKLVYLPKGDRWIDYYTGEITDGGNYIIKDAPIDICPIYIKVGSIIPEGPEQSFVGQKKDNILTLNLYLPDDKADFEYSHYIDDGESFDYKSGVYNEYLFEVETDSEKINITYTMKSRGYDDDYKEIEIISHNLKGRKIIINGKKFETEGGITVQNEFS